VIDRGYRRVTTARSLVNATVAWAAFRSDTVLRVAAPHARYGADQPDRGAQAVRQRNVYVFQNGDGRLIFASPYERDFTLIGSTGHPFRGIRQIVAMDVLDVAYLCDAANRYFREQIAPVDVLRTISGANSVIAPERRRTRDGAMTLDVRPWQGALADDFRRRRHHLAA